MDHSGKGSKFRRVLPFALAGVGVYAVVAYGSSMFNSTPTRLVAQRVAPAEQVVATSDQAAAVPAGPVQVPGQAPVSGALGQVGQIGQDVLPADAAAVTRNLNNATTTTVIPSGVGSAPASSAPATATSSTPSQPAGLLGGIPIVNNLPAAGALNNLPVQNLTGSGLLPTNTLKNIGGLGGVQLPQVNGQSLGGGLLP